MDNNKGGNPNEKDVYIDSLLSYYNPKDNSAGVKDSASAESKPGTEPSGASTEKRAYAGYNNQPNAGSQQGNAQKKKFVVHIDDDEFNFSKPSNSQKPADSSSIYFSNYKGKNVTVIPDNRAKPQIKSSANGNKTANAKTNTKNTAKKEIKTVGSRFAIILFACIILFTSLASYFAITSINDILAITSSDEAIPVRVYKKAPNGEENLTETLSYDEVIDILARDNLINRKSVCKLFAKFRNFDDEDYKYKPGVYTLKKNMGVEGMLYKCLQQNKSAETVTVSFPEGWTITQMFEKLDKNKVCSAKSLYAVLEKYSQETSDSNSFLTFVPKSEDRYQDFEGYLFPDTYDFYVESTPDLVIDKLFKSFGTHWTAEYQAQADKLGLSMDEIITIASIIQKEAADSSQMKDVSSVIHNRLRNSINYPSIGCDSTYDYISNYFDAANFAISQKSYYLSVYATDKNRGLPPGPICNPGEDAINAALYPSSTNYYFFQHDKRGHIYLASTKSQFDYDYSVVQRINNED